jgi:hypothetical protein
MLRQIYNIMCNLATILRSAPAWKKSAISCGSTPDDAAFLAGATEEPVGVSPGCCHRSRFSFSIWSPLDQTELKELKAATKLTSAIACSVVLILLF